VNRAAPDPQHTLSRSVEERGSGLHSGVPVRARLSPAPAGSGIRFVRTDLPGGPEVRVGPSALLDGLRCTTLETAGIRVRTSEHLLAALLGLGVDNVRIELDAEELPILDGSALGWASCIQAAGLAAQDAPRQVLQLTTPVVWAEGATTLMALPHAELRLTVASLTDHPVAGRQLVDVRVTPESFLEELAPARTFCFEEEVEKLFAAGLARGGSLDNALVVKRDGYSSPLRVEQELAAHKALDLLGDLATLGVPLQAHVVAVMPGHAANQQLVHAIAGQCRGALDDQDRSERALACSVRHGRTT